MPNVGGVEYPYTPKGIKASEAARSKDTSTNPDRTEKQKAVSQKALVRSFQPSY